MRGLSKPLTRLVGLKFLGGELHRPGRMVILKILLLRLKKCVGPFDKAEYSGLVVVQNKLLWRRRYLPHGLK